ncbi:lipopolysaccharide export system permease protein [Arachidicoccus rhizosphaerae]|uniref:Lipopolysaccharide export system permease protein n=1 Tax=Arachidicoccus rhizosphaerae TaxID=551991 RepID=A0A1H3ZJ03_9BACT|nr:LptF/LptG family permease [Arachidicoccus rhizosphaerae]SEA23736.1 lipopolysaccharide export system permease protein [Arachidicoccus rhizosphaerae]
MIKKLDKLIIRSFVGPFIATFLISNFVLVMQVFWLWIDDLVGKGLDFFVVMKLIGFITATIVPLALPLSLLLSSIMTFGKLGESFELVAIKSAGISLERFMRPLLVVAIGLSGVAYLFANNIIPVVNLKKDRLMFDIISSKPALNIKVGSFYDKIEGFVIRVGKKDKDSKHIGDVVIYEKNHDIQDNLLTAKEGTMEMSPDKLTMDFTLKDGHRYEESGPRYGSNTQFVRMSFKTYRKSFDMSSFKLNKTDENSFKYNPRMLTYRQLVPAIDSLEGLAKGYQKRTRILMRPYLATSRYLDSSWSKQKVVLPKYLSKDPDEVYLSTLSDSVKRAAITSALSQISSASNNIDMAAKDFKDLQGSIRSHYIEMYRKFTLSVACILLFMIGAPLGSIIRKGGLGSPLVFSIIFFVLFYLLNTIGERLAKQGVVSCFTGMWLSSFVLFPIGLFLTIKAMRDSQLFNNEAYFRFFKKVRSFFKKKKGQDIAVDPA